LDAAEALYQAHLWPQACFNAQQCVELMFKAAIVGTNVAPPRVHGTMDLLGCLDTSIQQSLQQLMTDLRSLDLYYAPTRYPDAQPGTLPGGLPGQDEATAALNVAREVARIVEPMLP
jgi:HEPN domain-containing protein